jgi:hypothetical protein
MAGEQAYMVIGAMTICMMIIKPKKLMPNSNPADHDLLIELRTEVQNIRNDIKELKDGVATRIASLETDKADRKVVEELQGKVNHDLEVRVRVLEGAKSNYYTMSVIYAGIGATMIGLILYHLFQK